MLRREPDPGRTVALCRPVACWCWWADGLRVETLTPLPFVWLIEMVFALARPEYLCEWRFTRLPCTATHNCYQKIYDVISRRTGSEEKTGPSGNLLTMNELFFCDGVSAFQEFHSKQHDPYAEKEPLEVVGHFDSIFTGELAKSR